MKPDAPGDMPQLSIVVPTYHSAATLERCLASLRAQSWQDFETLIIDGGSTDGTADIAHRHLGAGGRGSFVSERDGGIYEAINKGIAKAQGRWVYILGSDDELHDAGVLESCVALWRGDADLIYGKVYRRSTGQLQGGQTTFTALCLDNVCQQAIFYRRSLFDAFGVFDVRYRLCADWAFNVRCFASRRCVFLDRVVAIYAGDGRSSNVADLPFYRDRVDLICDAVGADCGSDEVGAVRYLLLERVRIELATGRRRTAVRYLFWFLFHAARARLRAPAQLPMRAAGR